MYRHNSTIRVKEKPCARCGRLSPIFSKGRCKQCATLEDTLQRKGRHEERELEADGLSDLMKSADAIFSRYIRLKAANEKGILSCYTCGAKVKWTEAQNMHFMRRGHSFLRLDERNCRAGCKKCNEYLDGNMSMYREMLNNEYPGLPDLLEEESHLTYKWSRHELQRIIDEYTLKFNKLKAIKNL